MMSLLWNCGNVPPCHFRSIYCKTTFLHQKFVSETYFDSFISTLLEFLIIIRILNYASEGKIKLDSFIMGSLAWLRSSPQMAEPWDHWSLMNTDPLFFILHSFISLMSEVLAMKEMFKRIGSKPNMVMPDCFGQQRRRDKGKTGRKYWRELKRGEVKIPGMPGKPASFFLLMNISS